MKKTLTALAALGALAGSALAADVTLYGIVDQGFSFTRSDTDSINGTVNSFSMDSGIQSGNRVGLKGIEDLGNGLSVGFVLENGFSADTGTLGQSNRLFGREANLFIRSEFGELSFGRVGNLQSGNGSYGLTGDFSPFGTSYGDYAAQAGNVFVGMTRLDNALTYKSPTFAGVTAYAQYSFKMDSVKDTTGAEGKASTNRYAALGATYTNGALKLAGVVDTLNYASDGSVDIDDAFTVTLGGSYDFEVVKFYAGGQYFDNVLDLGYAIKGYSLITGLDIPAFGGTAKVGFAYADNELVHASDTTVKIWTGSVGYDYALSKRTNVYAVGSYQQVKATDGIRQLKPSDANVSFGLRHKF